MNDALTPDQWVWGGYVLLGYESPLFGVMPYLIVERTQNWLNPLGIEGAAALYGGLNWRAHPRFTVKLQGTYIFLEGSSAFGRSRIPTIDAQVAWAF